MCIGLKANIDNGHITLPNLGKLVKFFFFHYNFMLNCCLESNINCLTKFYSIEFGFDETEIFTFQHKKEQCIQKTIIEHHFL